MSVVNRTMSYKTRTLITLLFALSAVVYILSAGGCDIGQNDVVKEINEPHFLRGQEELRRGNTMEAMSAFMKVTEKRKDAPESHFELGRIYLDKLNDPFAAIYHFRKFLEYKPNSKESDIVRQMIETAKKKVLADMPESPFENNIRRMELEDLLKKVQRENLELKQKLNAAAATIDRLESTQRVSVAQATQRPAASAQQSAISKSQKQTASASANRPIEVKRDTPSTYLVKTGDTLSSISRKVYGTPKRWREIYGANRDRMATPESLKPGQVLRIPR